MGHSKGKKTRRETVQGNVPVTEPSVPAHASTPEKTFLTSVPLHLLLLTIAAIAIYAAILNAPFVFDDRGCIIENPAITSISFPFDKTSLKTLNLDEDLYKNIILRPVTYASFALNHYLGGFDVRGYHAFNLAVHLANAMLVYWLIVLTAKSPYFGTRGRYAFPPPSLVAFFSAILFVCHPMQIQAVTYVTQRFASLATCLYLCALSLYLCFRLAEKSGVRWLAYAGSVITAVLAMNAKEIAFTLPVVICLFECMFFTGPLRKRVLLLTPLLLTLPIIPIKVMQLATEMSNETGSAMNRSLDLVNYAGVSNWEYLITQFRVIMGYLRLLVLPVGQNIDHAFPLATTFFSLPILLSFSALGALLGTGAVLLHLSGKDDNPERHWLRLVAFGIFWFFITISVESSIIPLDDLMVEQRVYLPSVGFFIAVVSATGFVAGKVDQKISRFRATLIVALCLVTLVLSVASHRRNSVWQDPITLWLDAAQKSPNKARPFSNLGAHYYERGLFPQALQAVKRAVQLNPGSIESRHNLANLYLELKQYEIAERAYLQLMKLQPDNEKICNNLGQLYFQLKLYEKAAFFYKRALGMTPYFLAARINLAELYEAEGRYDKAVVEYENAARISPKDTMVREKLRQLRAGTMNR